MLPTQGSKKRKASQELDPKDRGWDRTTFRVRNIPQQFDRPRLSQTLTELLELEDTSWVKIHSFVSQGFEESHAKVATISFRRRPLALSLPTVEWQLQLGEDSNEEKLFIDTRFNNFTLLAPGEESSEGANTIE